MQNLIVITNTLGGFGTNCYSVVNQQTREAVFIDPADNAKFLIEMYKNQDYKCVGILLTHGHVDHIGAVEGIKEAFPNISVYAGVEEEDVLQSTKLNLSSMFGKPITLSADKYVADDEFIDILGVKVKCIHVPGHTKGGTCYYFEENNMLFSGDTLFAQSIGRSDFPTGDGDLLLDSIESKLFALPDEVQVYPGHMHKTTIKAEKENNPFF